ncbi:hypothetical protein [Bacillus sp. Hm123]|uniref:hypothetical protein n=1 Tax=Bacillus sp. Hm123 TaxID=3450745 RepID=UPI003F43D858
MSPYTILFLIYADACIGLGVYLYVFRRKKLIGFQLGMNISILMGGMAALLFGILLILQYPFHYTLITMISTLVGAAVGALFGLLFDYQTFVTGFTNGLVIGLMAPMIGSVLEVPHLFIWFIHGLFVVSLLFVHISIKRS